MIVLTTLEPLGKKIERKFPRTVQIGSRSFGILMLAFLLFKLITDQEIRKIWTVHHLFIGVLIVGFLLSSAILYQRYKKKKEETPWGLIALLVSGFFLVAYLEFLFLRDVGEKTAQDQKTFHVFLVSSSSPSEVPAIPNPPSIEVAVIRTSGDYLLTVPFTRDPKWAVFHNKLIIVKMSDSKSPISLSLEQIGPLHKPGTTPPQP
jgi:hypothetical protein